MEEFQLWDFKVVDWSRFANAKMKVEDHLLVRMEELECIRDGAEVMVGYLMELGEIL